VPLWLAPWLTVLFWYAVVAALVVRVPPALVVRVPPARDVPLPLRRWVLLLIALLLGMLFAAPWFYALYRLAMH
jgi:hypothetical protein